MIAHLHFFTFLQDTSKRSTLMFAISALKLGTRVSHSLSARPPVVWLTLAGLSDRCSPRPAAARVTLQLLTTSISGLHKREHGELHDATSRSGSCDVGHMRPPQPSLYNSAAFFFLSQLWIWCECSLIWSYKWKRLLQTISILQNLRLLRQKQDRGSAP